MSLYQPGLMVRLDPEAELMEIGDVVVDEVFDGYRFLCTGDGGWTDDPPRPRMVDRARVVVGGPGRNSPLTLWSAHMEPSIGKTQWTRWPTCGELCRSSASPVLTVLVAHGTGVASTRLFAEGATDVEGVVLVDPVAVGFSELLQSALAGDGTPIFGLDDRRRWVTWATSRWS